MAESRGEGGEGSSRKRSFTRHSIDDILGTKSSEGEAGKPPTRAILRLTNLVQPLLGLVQHRTTCLALAVEIAAVHHWKEKKVQNAQRRGLHTLGSRKKHWNYTSNPWGIPTHRQETR